MAHPPLHVAVTGAAGRMGQAVLAAIAATDDVTLSAALLREGHAQLGQPVPGHAGLLYQADIPAALQASDAVIDFTLPEGCLTYAQASTEAGCAFVTGATGLDDSQKAALRAIAGHIPLLHAANMSIGVTVLKALVRQAAAALGPDCDVDVLDIHHRQKRDAPSGTALALGEAAAEGRAVSHQPYDAQRSAEPRPDGAVGYSVLRSGQVIGEHSVQFASASERITLSHRAEQRSLFAEGALRAARWLVQQKPGLYDMEDVLAL